MKHVKKVDMGMVHFCSISLGALSIDEGKDTEEGEGGKRGKQAHNPLDPIITTVGDIAL